LTVGLGINAVANNTAVGISALAGANSGTGENTAVGVHALIGNTTGSDNTAVGAFCLGANTTGDHNTGISAASLNANITGSYNSAYGFGSLFWNTAGNRNVAIGTYAGYFELGSNAFYLNNVMQANTAGDKAYSLLYGQFSGTAGSLTGQQLTVNGALTVNGNVAATNLSGSNTGDNPGVTSVSGTAPVVSSGTSTPTISMAAATASVDGYATSTQITKLDGIAAGATANSTDTVLQPTGAIQMYGGATAPTGWLLCDGAAVSRTTYGPLFTAISTNFGVGDNSTTFNVPDMRGVYPKGAGTTNRAAGKDANGNYYASTLGTYTTDKMQGHVHQVFDHYADPGTTYVYPQNFVRVGGLGVDQIVDVGVPKTDGTNGTPRTGMTTEPQNLGLTFIIKT
jgi:microcystin-dependent protein